MFFMYIFIDIQTAIVYIAWYLWTARLSMDHPFRKKAGSNGMNLYYSPHCIEYSHEGHPESSDRILSTGAYLKNEGYTFLQPAPADREDILRVHTEAMVEAVETGCFSDPDTPVLPDIDRYAKLAAGSAVMAAESAIRGEPAFSLMRPPGHHATADRVMGFCYFNNIAVAAARYLYRNPDSKVAILDIDCHHGNGTETIFLGNDAVLYVSLHQSPLFPGTGLQSRQNCMNFPLEPGTEEKTYLETLEKACGLVDAFQPSLLGISAGFDTYKSDPLAHLQLDMDTYYQIGRMIADLKLPAFAVLEGGYSHDLPQCVGRFLDGIQS